MLVVFFIKLTLVLILLTQNSQNTHKKKIITPNSKNHTTRGREYTSIDFTRKTSSLFLTSYNGYYSISIIETARTADTPFDPPLKCPTGLDIPTKR